MNLFKRSKKQPHTIMIKDPFGSIKRDIINAGHEYSAENAYKIWNVYSISNDIAQNVATLPFRHYQRHKDGEPTEIENQISQLFFKRPNQLDNARMFRRKAIINLILNGNIIMWVTGSKERPLELIMLPSNRVKAIESPDGLIDYYEYRPRRKQMVRLQPEEIIHIRTVNPDNDIWGMSAIEAASKILSLQESSINWNKSIMDNHGKPEGAWVAEMDLTTEQAIKMRKQIKEATNDYETKGEPLVYGNGLKYEQFSLSPKDVDWILSDKAALRKVCAILRYPSQLLGDADAQTYSNIREMEKRLFNDTVIPYGEEICEALNHYFYSGETSYFQIDESKIRQIQTNILDKASAIKGLPVVQVDWALQQMGMEPLGDEAGGNQILVASGYMPIDMILGEPPLPPKGEE